MRRPKQILIGFTVILAVPFLYAAHILLALNSHHQTLKAFQAEGLPQSIAELETASKQSDSTVEFIRAMRHLDIESPDELLPIDPGFCCTYTVYTGFSPEEIESASQILEAHSPLIELLDELRNAAIEKPGVLSRYGNPDDAMVEFYVNTARLLANASIIAAEEGDPVEAHDHLERLMWLNTTFESAPNLRHASAYYENRRLELSIVEYLLSATELTTLQLQKIEIHIQSFEHRDKLDRGIAGEHVTTLDFYEWSRMNRMYTNAAEPDLEFKQLLGLSYLVPHQYFPLRKAYSARMLDWVLLSKQKDRSGLSLYDSLEHFYRGAPQSEFLPFQLSDDWVYYAMLRRLLLLAEHRVTLTGLHVERYRRQEGKLPRSLDEIVPRFSAEIPIDPFTGNPLGACAGDGYFGVYSFGEDRFDSHHFKNGRQTGNHENMEFTYLSPELLHSNRERFR